MLTILCESRFPMPCAVGFLPAAIIDAGAALPSRRCATARSFSTYRHIRLHRGREDEIDGASQMCRRSQRCCLGKGRGPPHRSAIIFSSTYGSHVSPTTHLYTRALSSSATAGATPGQAFAYEGQSA